MSASTARGAPVCRAINQATFYETVPGVSLISDFSFQGLTPSAAIGTDCTDNPGLYSGCMTTACFPSDGGLVNCVCPNTDGPFQVGQEDVAFEKTGGRGPPTAGLAASQ